MKADVYVLGSCHRGHSVSKVDLKTGGRLEEIIQVRFLAFKEKLELTIGTLKPERLAFYLVHETSALDFAYSC